jgi:hypothetical protein
MPGGLRCSEGVSRHKFSECAAAITAMRTCGKNKVSEMEVFNRKHNYYGEFSRNIAFLLSLLPTEKFLPRRQVTVGVGCLQR